MIRIYRDKNLSVEEFRKQTLTPKNLYSWYEIWKKEVPSFREKHSLVTNKKSDGTYLLKFPFAKKLVLTSSSMTIGNGIKLSLSEDAQKDAGKVRTFEEINRLYKKQSMDNHRAVMFNSGSTYGVGYELVYPSSDESPVPKTAKYLPTNAFVVYDDTVETDSVYGVIIIDEYKKDNKAFVNMLVYDEKYEYKTEIEITSGTKPENLSQSALEPITNALGEAKQHNMGRVPVNEFLNNEERQSDFEQVVPLMLDRTLIHDLNLRDMKNLPKTALKSINIDLAGDTAEEQIRTRQNIEKTQVLNAKPADSSGMNENTQYELEYMSKPENYSSIDVFGRDTESKIYDLSLIPDLSSDKFAGNATGAALEQKQAPFKKMVESKNTFIEKLEYRRLKQYIHFLEMKEVKSGESKFAHLDAEDIDISIKRSWTENMLELSQLIATLKSTDLYSDKYLTELMPDTTYDIEKKRREFELKTKQDVLMSNPDPNNPMLSELAALFRETQPKINDEGLVNGNNPEL